MLRYARLRTELEFGAGRCCLGVKVKQNVYLSIFVYIGEATCTMHLGYTYDNYLVLSHYRAIRRTKCRIVRYGGMKGAWRGTPSVEIDS
jgi:hypothetical protein